MIMGARYTFFVFGEKDENLKIGEFESKEDLITAISEFLDFFEKNMDARRIDLVIVGREEEGEK